MRVQLNASLNHVVQPHALQFRTFLLFFPAFKVSYRPIIQLALLLIILADALRKGAMLYAFWRVRSRVPF